MNIFDSLFIIVPYQTKHNLSGVNGESCMLNQVFLGLLYNQNAKTIFIGLKLKQFHGQLSELEIVLDALSFLLQSIPSINEPLIDKQVPEKTMRKRSLSFKTKSSRYKSSIF